MPHTDIGEVFVVGSGDCGQLGLGPDVTSKGRPGRLDYFADKQIVEVAAGGLHNMALSTDGKVLSHSFDGDFRLVTKLAVSTIVILLGMQ
jgi:regulator of chromosome condensation